MSLSPEEKEALRQLSALHRGGPQIQAIQLEREDDSLHYAILEEDLVTWRLKNFPTTEPKKKNENE